MRITREMAARVREVVDAGLSAGLGVATPGQMCVEAAVCYALGLPHGDDPGCVDPAVRRLKIRLNDSAAWPSASARAAGLRRLAIAQLGSRGAIDTPRFAQRVAEMTIRTVVPAALRAAARLNSTHAAALESAAGRCERDGTREAATQAEHAAAAARYAAADARYAADDARDAADARSAAKSADDYAAYAADAAESAADADAVTILSAFAESVVQILIELGSPGCEFLDLVPVEATGD